MVDEAPSLVALNVTHLAVRCPELFVKVRWLDETETSRPIRVCHGGSLHTH